MATASTSSVSEEELVRDAALCLRSFYGSKDVITYSKFCERFKKNAGYSIKEHLRNCDYNFADVMAKVSMTTRTKCEYDAEQKMIKLIPDKTPINGKEPIFSVHPNFTGYPVLQPRPLPLPLHSLNPYAPPFVPHPQMVMFTIAPLIPGLPPLVQGGVPTFHQMSPAAPSTAAVPPMNSGCSIDSEVINDDDVQRVYDSTAEESSTIGKMPPSSPSATVPWSTCDGFRVDSGEVFIHDTVHELTGTENFEQVTEVPQPLSWSYEENMDDFRYDDAEEGEEYATPAGNTVHGSWSAGDDPEQMASSDLNSAEEADDSYYYDAEEEFSPGISSHPASGHQISWKRSETDILSEASHSETDTSTMEDRSSETSLDSSEFSYRMKCASCSDLRDDVVKEKKEQRRDSMPELLVLRDMDFCPGEEYAAFESTDAEEDKARRKRLMLQVFDRLRKNQKVEVWRGSSLTKSRVQLDVAGTSKDIHSVYELTQLDRVMLVRRRPSDHSDIRQLRVEAKKECIRLWDDKVQNLAELLCFLKLFHSLNGPMLIDDCEYHIEAYVNSSCAEGDLSWTKYGKDMSVRRMFELKMFRLAEPLNRMKVQPVDCILNARFRVLSEGLTSEVYRILAGVKKATVEDMFKQIQKLRAETDEEIFQEELRRAVCSAPDVFALYKDCIELKNDDEFFVVTGIPL